MARLQTVDELRTSGYRLTVLREGDDFATFTEDMLAEMREGALERMARAQQHIVRAVHRALSRQYPVLRAAGWKSRGMVLLQRFTRIRERRRPAPPGAPPGRITGDFLRSWTWRKPTWARGKTVLRGAYFSRHPAAGVLERGSPSQGIPARPYQRPTLIREAARLERILDGAA